VHHERLRHLRCYCVTCLLLDEFDIYILILGSGGLLADRIGRLNLLWPLTLLSGLLCLFLWLLGNSLAILVLFACCFGMTMSNINALPASVIGQITPDGSLGARVGAFYSVIAIASLVGTPIGGALIVDREKKEGYQWLILFSVSIVHGWVQTLG
jgi:MCP family monocarboxylic acid transporter-like MFS transporter 10